jgi:hypothetical protein
MVIKAHSKVESRRSDDHLPTSTLENPLAGASWECVSSREKHVCPTYLYIKSRHILQLLHFQSIVAHIHVQNVAALEI